MTAVVVKSYQRSQPPSDQASYVRYLEAELRKLQEVIASQNAAIKQLQAAVKP